jgi:hypothetical protein
LTALLSGPGEIVSLTEDAAGTDGEGDDPGLEAEPDGEPSE